jgi:hypothetical protein
MKELPLKQQRGQPVQKKTKGERKFGRERSVEFGGVNPKKVVCSGVHIFGIHCWNMLSFGYIALLTSLY